MASGRRQARLRVRLMTAQDLKQVDAIEQVCFGADAWPRHAFRELLQVFRQAHPTRGGLWVAEDPGKGEVLGYAGIEVSALWGEADIINIAVAQAHRRRGVGRMLLEWTIRRCRRSGIEMLWLRVRESNRSARRFYRVWDLKNEASSPGITRTPTSPPFSWRWIWRDP